MSASKWFARVLGGMSGVAGPGDDLLLYTRRGQQFLSTRPNLAWGVKNLAAPIAIAGKVQFVDKVILGGASARTLEVITFGKYQAPQSAWDKSPRSRLGRLHTHGYQVKPSDRMRKNKPLRTSSEWWAHYDRQHQHS